jgi:tetratricopeptide (TPR) repeat protein
MELVPAMEGDHRSIANRERDRGSTTIHERLIELSSWMMVIGTVRIICGFADYVTAFLEEFPRGPVAPGEFSRFAEENSPIVACCIVWPLVLGVALRRTRWPQLLLAAGVTLLILSLGGVLALTAEWFYSQERGVTIGSFHLTRRAFLNPRLSDVAMILMGAIQLLVEFTTALRALLLVHQFGAVQRSTAEPSKSELIRRARIGRLAIYVSFGFMLLLVRLPVWATYLGLLQDSRFLREFVISNDLRRIRNPAVAYKLTKEEEHLRILQMKMGAAYGSSHQGRFLDAKDAYIGIISEVDSVSEKSMPRGYSSLIAEAHNNLAWLLATCPNTELHDAPEALRLARRAVEVEPQQGNFWNTLGVAFYRAGELEEAKKALEKSLELRNAGDSFDWFFLALVDLKRGKPDQAREWYDKAVAWYQNNRPDDRELFRFNVEAAGALGLTSPTYKQTNSVLERSKTTKPIGGPTLFNPRSRLRRDVMRPSPYHD